MLYLLTQHSLWNRKFHPYLLCQCGKGTGVTNHREHQCIKIPHAETVALYNRSKLRWDLKTRREGDKYTVKLHMDWIDKNTKGVSHFGLHPNLLPRENIRFDTFHMKCAVTQKLMN